MFDTLELLSIYQGQTLFWRRKMRTLHNHLDVDKDGVISYDDFMLFEKRFSNLGHLTPEAKTEFKKILNVSQSPSYVLNKKIYIIYLCIYT